MEACGRNFVDTEIQKLKYIYFSGRIFSIFRVGYNAGFSLRFGLAACSWASYFLSFDCRGKGIGGGFVGPLLSLNLSEKSGGGAWEWDFCRTFAT